jgi:hypothetical protein
VRVKEKEKEKTMLMAKIPVVVNGAIQMLHGKRGL